MSQFANNGRLTARIAAQAENDSPVFKSTKVATLVNEMAVAVEAGGSPGSPTTFHVSFPGGADAADGDTLTLGADVYEFLTAAGTVADDGNIGVVRGGGSVATRESLVAAINGAASTTGLLKSDGSAANAVGTETFFAVAMGGQDKVRISSANAVGGTIVGAYLEQTVSSTGAVLAFDSPLTGGGLLSASALGGANPADQSMMLVQAEFSAADLAAGFKEIVFPSHFDFSFSGTSKYWVTAVDSNGVTVPRDEFPMAGAEANVLEYTFFNGGGAPNIQADDTLTFWGRP